MGLAEAAGLLACPHCRGRLAITGRTVGCPAGHSFDLARQGYLNLLGSAQPANADTAAMLAARSRVQEAGLFEPVAAAVTRAVGAVGPLLEVGAGTGYYLSGALGRDAAAVGVALDVSTAAARACAARDRRIAAVVADVWRPLPLTDAAFDAVLCVFAPRNLPEFARVVRPGGRLVVATPGDGHLAGLRDRHGLLRIEADKAARLAAAAGAHFRLVSSEQVVSTVELTAAQATDLIGMGPNAFHRAPGRVDAATVHLHVVVSSFEPLPH